MQGIGLPHLIIFGLIALLLFGGRGKISGVMGDFAKGIKAFREGLKDEDKTADAKSDTALPRTDKEKES